MGWRGGGKHERDWSRRRSNLRKEGAQGPIECSVDPFGVKDKLLEQRRRASERFYAGMRMRCSSSRSEGEGERSAASEEEEEENDREVFTRFNVWRQS